ncbi:Acetyltransferase (GNAT) family [Rubrobacter radiotolerans]|uniref:Acetyltransferase (GNAT) family n=1 Tax=Rubrobacter radiotolerans TaxID=42256 RepID=A0A023X304_RUBRA|nr:GNAT family N-acetyltransferase [Rubrobacter radiotolerans]AHY46390.1 Acetyltransferase (GNAT) family [Rubrobacter radiotolerans]MDX5893797.1 GNAT family N-acetyltransferase [Rubrobacter radiotolerans]SMC04518.1 Acetyltransferase (GNAT) family protein [Rubrobacter radiotolerans DSM 5868]
MTGMEAERFTLRDARPEDDPAIAALVIDGFLDKFRPVFGRGMEESVRIMERWVSLEHFSGGVQSFVVEGCEAGEVVASVGVRVSPADDEVMARGLWRALSRNLGFLRAMWATTLLSYPRYSARSSEAYVERLVVAPGFRNQGMARSLLAAAEDLARQKEKRTVGLHVSGNNIPALKLYEDEGYVEVSRQRSLLTARFLKIRDWIYLRKDLSPSVRKEAPL